MWNSLGRVHTAKLCFNLFWYYLALEVNFLLFCTPRITFSCDGILTPSAQVCRQWAAVRNMLLPICKKKEKVQERKRFYPPMLQRIGCSLLWSPPQRAKDQSMDERGPRTRDCQIRFYPWTWNYLSLHSSNDPCL